mgnify:CR=1 FL=1
MKWYLVLVVILLNSCAPIALNPHYNKCKFPFTCEQGPQIVPTSANQLLNLPLPNNKAVVAVYSFPDNFFSNSTIYFPSVKSVDLMSFPQ